MKSCVLNLKNWVLMALVTGFSANVLAQAPASKSAITTPSGLVFESLKEGNGANPLASDRVKVHYRGTFLDGREFDSSYQRGQPAEFPLNRVIPCWTEGVQLMKVGGKAHWWRDSAERDFEFRYRVVGDCGPLRLNTLSGMGRGLCLAQRLRHRPHSRSRGVVHPD
jgi:FKBP-type peptidyl-prolyl cis-trans isomerase